MAEACTPASSVGNAPGTKDKECPFCQHLFTSSSLGRHLDLYIREKNPKPPDDKHDVQEIRKLRRNITRRQARNSRQRGNVSPTSLKAIPLQDQHSPMLPKSHPNGRKMDPEFFRTYVNQVHWHATGVINDLPPTPQTDQQMWGSKRNPTLKTNVKDEIYRKQEYLEVLDQGRAAELALKEVLESVKAAK